MNIHNSYKTGHFRDQVNQCKETTTECECWKEAAKNIKFVKDCMIGIKFTFLTFIFISISFSQRNRGSSKG